MLYEKLDSELCEGVLQVPFFLLFDNPLSN